MEKIFYEHIWQMADHLGKSIEAVRYMIIRGRLPDPRVTPVDPNTLVYPKPLPKGGRLNPSTKRRIANNGHTDDSKFITIGDLVKRLDLIETRLSALENKTHSNINSNVSFITKD